MFSVPTNLPDLATSLTKTKMRSQDVVYRTGCQECLSIEENKNKNKKVRIQDL